MALWALALWPLIALAATPLAETAFGAGIAGKAVDILLQTVAPIAAFVDAKRVNDRYPRFRVKTWLLSLIVGPLYISRRCSATGVPAMFVKASWAVFLGSCAVLLATTLRG